MAFAFGFWDKTYREIRLGRGLGGKGGGGKWRMKKT
nr:MAG TPA: hypothetical protein [Caudoviricetes sp.]